jgi:hypothetical protein
MKYRKKPVIIEAIQYREGYPLSVIEFAGGSAMWSRESNVVKIETLEGNMIANVGDWIIRGVNGKFYPCKPDIFEKTYEEVKDGDK